jgi:NTE family protein
MAWPGARLAPDRPRQWPGRRRWLLAAAATAAAGALGPGAAGGEGAAATASSGPAAAPMASEPEAAPLALAAAPPDAVRTAWVFGSGGPRGFVHIGVLKGLAALGLRPDLVVGSSVGALAATLYAAGLDAGRLESLARSVQPWDLVRLTLRGPTWLSGDGIAGLVREVLGGRRLQDLPVPAACVALRLDDGELVAFTRGDAGLAVQASTAIVGRLAPVAIRGARYADPDLHMPLPVRIARSLGATRVLAVDASAHEDRAPPQAAAYRESDRRKRELTLPDARLADVLLHPDTGYWAGWSGAYRVRLIAAGEAAVRARADALRDLHARVHSPS